MGAHRPHVSRSYQAVHSSRSGHWISFVVVIGLLFASCGRQAPDAEIDGVRRGRVLIHAMPQAYLEIEIESTHGGSDYAYLQGPNGHTIEQRRLSPTASGTLARTLKRPGTYVLIPSPSHRMTVRVWHGTLTLVPETEFPSLHLTGTRRLDFDVPPETGAFTVHGTTQHGWEARAGEVRVFDPQGNERAHLTFDTLDQEGILRELGVTPEQIEFYRSQGDTAVVPEFRLLVKSARLEGPTPGRWSIEATLEGLTRDDIGFWLTGVPNRFAVPGTPFGTDDRGVVHAEVHLHPQIDVGPIGDVGAVWGFTVFPDKSRSVYRKLGLTGSKHFFPQVDMEPRNDDDDPDHLTEDAFYFSAFADRLEPYADPEFPLTALMAVTRIAPYALSSVDEIAEFASAAVGYHQRTLGLDSSNLYWQFLNEPNHYATRSEYVEAFRHVGDRLARDFETSGTPVAWGGPALGNKDTDDGAVDFSWIEALLREADPVLDFVVWNQYRLPRLEDTWRFRRHIDRADSLIRALDSDGQREEIIIGATNLRGGIVLENEKQDGAHSALWWPSVLCHTLGSGRVRLVNYFFLIDHGARRKGLLRADWSEKPVAHATAFVTDHLGDRVLDATSNHGALDVLASRDSEGGITHLLLVNRHDRALDVTCIADDPPEAEVTAHAMDAATGRVSSLDVTVDGAAVRVLVAARSLAALEFTFP